MVGVVAAAAAGLSALLLASATAFTVVKLAGAAYLVVLGVQALWGTRRGPAPDSDPPRTTVLARSPWAQGFLSNMLNPKLVVFFLALLPQFVPAGADPVTASLVLAGIFEAMAIVWLVAFSLTVARAGTMLRRPRVRLWIERTTGTVLIGLGLRLAAD